MTTTRSPINRPPTSRITPEAVSIYRAVVALQADPACEIWEEDGGQKRKLCDLRLALHVELRRKPWEATIPDTIGCDTPPDWMSYADHRASWNDAHSIRVALDEAMAA